MQCEARYRDSQFDAIRTYRNVTQVLPVTVRSSRLLLYSVGSPRPRRVAATASSGPGQGGLVKQRKESPSAPAANWNSQPAGISRQSAAWTSTAAASPLGERRQTFPPPARKYHVSSTVRCRTGREMAPGGRRTSTRLAATPVVPDWPGQAVSG